MNREGESFKRECESLRKEGYVTEEEVGREELYTCAYVHCICVHEQSMNLNKNGRVRSYAIDPLCTMCFPHVS